MHCESKTFLFEHNVRKTVRFKYFFHGCRQKLSAHKHIIECSTSPIVCCCTNLNNCIRDDTKAAARQSPNCIKKPKKIKYGEKLFSIWRTELLHRAMWHDHDIDFTRWQHPAMWQVALGWHAMEFAQSSTILEFYILTISTQSIFLTRLLTSG